VEKARAEARGEREKLLKEAEEEASARIASLKEEMESEKRALREKALERMDEAISLIIKRVLG